MPKDDDVPSSAVIFYQSFLSKFMKQHKHLKISLKTFILLIKKWLCMISHKQGGHENYLDIQSVHKNIDYPKKDSKFI